MSNAPAGHSPGRFSWIASADLRAAIIIGVRMKHLFDLAKAESAMELDEVRSLLRYPLHEPRVVAVSILDFRARRSASDTDERRALYEFYLATANAAAIGQPHSPSR
jgi:hypothetical protein